MASREKRYDLFDIVFDICSDTLSSRVLPNVEDKLTAIVWKEIKHKSVVHADGLKQLRQLVVSAEPYQRLNNNSTQHSTTQL